MSNTALLGSYGAQGNSGLMFRNKIINGAMEISQRFGATTVTPTASAYVLDRWQLQCTQASKLLIQQVSNAAAGAPGFPTYMGISTVNVYTPTSGDFFAMRQAIEGFNIADLAWGTAAARPITISFLVYCTKVGTFSGSLTNGDSGARRSYAFTYTVNSVNTWEYKTITIPGDTAGNWYLDNREGISLYLDCGSGSTYRTTAGAWGAGTFVGATGSVNLVAGSDVLYITGVQLEAGPVATPFERRPIGVETALAMRYYWKPAIPAGVALAGNAAGGGGGVFAQYHFAIPVTMRTGAVGNVSFSSSGNTNTTNVEVVRAWPDGFQINVSTSTSGYFQVNNITYSVSAEL